MMEHKAWHTALRCLSGSQGGRLLVQPAPEPLLPRAWYLRPELLKTQSELQQESEREEWLVGQREKLKNCR